MSSHPSVSRLMEWPLRTYERVRVRFLFVKALCRRMHDKWMQKEDCLVSHHIHLHSSPYSLISVRMQQPCVSICTVYCIYALAGMGDVSQEKNYSLHGICISHIHTCIYLATSDGCERQNAEPRWALLSNQCLSHILYFEFAYMQIGRRWIEKHIKGGYS